MRVIKPEWVNYESNKALYSIDIHPDGTRFATGGQGQDANTSSGNVIIWSFEQINDNEVSSQNPARSSTNSPTNNVDSVVPNSPDSPKKLCVLDNHLACVNTIRWSRNTGKFLASGGDDRLIMIWQFGGANKINNCENWTKNACLRGHDGDILDLQWSPRNKYLASCSIDNSIIIWKPPQENEKENVGLDQMMVQQFQGFNQTQQWSMHKRLNKHNAFVKGICWDPVGSYLASQGDDKSLMIWRVRDWQVEKQITSIFKKSTSTTSGLRLDWSPDGQFLVTANSMNNKCPSAQIIQRQSWDTKLDFVGHRKPITCVAFSKNLYQKTKNSDPYNCCAIASRDKSISIWTTESPRPLVVLHENFQESITDMSWWQNGLIVCSNDGSILYIEFSPKEIGVPLSQKSFNSFHKKNFGKTSLAIDEDTLDDEEDEDRGVIFQEDGNIVENLVMPSRSKNLLTDAMDEKMKKLIEEQERTKYADEKKYPKQQVETKTKSGKRRIQPKFVAPLDQRPVPFSKQIQKPAAKKQKVQNKMSKFTFFDEDSKMSKPEEAEVSGDDEEDDEEDDEDEESDGEVANVPESVLMEAEQEVDDEDDETENDDMDDKSGEILTENGKTDENGIDAAGIDVAGIDVAGIDTAEIDENGENSSNEAEVEVDSSDADESENENSDDEIETSTKQNIDMTQTDTIDMVSQSGEVNENHGTQNLNLNTILKSSDHPTQNTHGKTLPFDPKPLKNLIEFKKEGIEIRNDSNSKTTNIRSKNWNLALPTLVVEACIIQKKYLAIVTTDNEHDILTIYKLQTKPQFKTQFQPQNPQKTSSNTECSPKVASQSIALPGKLHKLMLSFNDYLIVSLNTGKFFVFEFRYAFGRQNLLKRLNIDYDLSDLLMSRNKSVFVVDCKINDSGMLTVVLSNSRAYQYNTDNKCWTSLMGGNFQPIFYDKNAYIQAGSLTLNSENRFESNLVCWAQNEALKVGESKSNNFSFTETETSKLGLMVGTSLSGNITFMQSQVETAISSNSSSEWRHWMVVYVRFLVMCCNSPSMVDSCKVRISGILEDMLGPTVELDEIDNVMMEEEDRKNEIETNSWKPKMLGVDKRVFLKEQVLPLMSKSVHLQRLYQEFNEQL